MPTNDIDEIQISFPDIIQTIWELRIPAILLAVIGGILGILISAAQPDSYVTTASMVVTAKTSSGLYQNEASMPGIEDFTMARNLADYVQFLATTNLVLNQVVEESGFTGEEAEVMLSSLQSSVEVSQVGQTTAFIISLSWEDSEQAQVLLDALMQVLPVKMQELLDIGAVNVVDNAGQAKLSRRGGVPLLYPLIGVGGSFAVICVVSIVYSIRHPRVRDERSLKDCGVEFLGRIPKMRTKEKGEAAAFLDADVPGGNGTGTAGESRKTDREHMEAEKNRGSYGRLVAVLRHELEHDHRKIIAVTSANPGEGKTTVAYNLALSMQEIGCRVLLLDCDFRHGSLYQYARKHKEYDGETREPRDGELRKFVEKLDSGIYTIVGFAKKKLFRVEGELASAIRELKDDFSFILIDTPAVRVYPDILHIGKMADGVLLVVREDMATADAVYETVKELNAAGIDMIGGVLNCV